MKKSAKVFLTEECGETGSICWYVDNSSSLEFYQIEAQVKFYDCNRSISLDFDCFDNSDIVNRISKANTLLEQITEFRDALVASTKKSKFHY